MRAWGNKAQNGRLIGGFLVALTAALALQACGVLGIPTPQGFNQRLAAGYASVTAVRESATTLLTSNSISVDDAKKVQQKCDEARALLDNAAALRGVDFQGSENRLAAATAVLTALQAFVADRQSGVKREVPQ